MHKERILADFDRILVTEKQAARLLSISPRSMFSLAATGKIRPVRINRSKRYDVKDLRHFVESQKREKGSATHA